MSLNRIAVFEVRLMVHTHARRGRPKGTGIDDSDRIGRLIELLRSQPELKPTTAIRLMGFSDPSAIRRLRDKYKQLSHSAATALLPAPQSAANPASARSRDCFAAAEGPAAH
jgi:hypothetical protein